MKIGTIKEFTVNYNAVNKKVTLVSEDNEQFNHFAFKADNYEDAVVKCRKEFGEDFEEISEVNE